MSNVIISRTRQEVILDLPSLTSVGEEFDLVGKRFAPGTVGRVTQVLGQSGGYTRVRLAVYKGNIRPHAHQQITNQYNEEVDDRRLPPTSMDASSVEPLPAGGSSWIGMDNDPRPRQGVNNNVVESDNGNNSMLYGDDEGSIVILKNDNNTQATGASSLSVSDPQTVPGRVKQPKTPTETVSSVIGIATGRGGATSSTRISQEDHAKAFGGKIDNKVGAVGGKRIGRKR